MLVIFISHRMAEVRRLADRITVFRNGETVAAHDTAAVTDDEIVAEMIGRRLDRLYPEREADRDRPRRAEDPRPRASATACSGVDLDLHEGEVLGVGGLQGHGQRELFQALFGVGRSQGSIELWGQPAACPLAAPGAVAATASRSCPRTAAARGCCSPSRCART